MIDRITYQVPIGLIEEIQDRIIKFEKLEEESGYENLRYALRAKIDSLNGILMLLTPQPKQS